MIRITTRVRKALGTTKHTIFGRDEDPQELGVNAPHPMTLEIIEESKGSFYLYRFDNNGKFITDTWHQSLQEAKEQADFEYEIDEWAEIKSN